MVRESTVEAYLHSRVKALGGTTFKLAPTTVGMPDRMVILPGGVISLVELKTETGRLSTVQKLLHGRLAELGVQVYTLYGKLDVDDWIMVHG